MVVPNISLNVTIVWEKSSPVLLWGIGGAPEIQISISQRFEILCHVWSTSLILYRLSGQLRLCFVRLTSNSFHGKNESWEKTWNPHIHLMVTMPDFQQHNLSESFCLLHCVIAILLWRVNVPIPPHRSPPLGDYTSTVESSLLSGWTPSWYFENHVISSNFWFLTARKKIITLVRIVTQVPLPPPTNLIAPHVKEKRREKENRGELVM